MTIHFSSYTFFVAVWLFLRALLLNRIMFPGKHRAVERSVAHLVGLKRTWDKKFFFSGQMSGQLNLAITGFMLLVLMATHPIHLRFADTEHLQHPSSLIALTLLRATHKHVPLVLDFESLPSLV